VIHRDRCYVAGGHGWGETHTIVIQTTGLNQLHEDIEDVVLANVGGTGDEDAASTATATAGQHRAEKRKAPIKRKLVTPAFLHPTSTLGDLIRR
jgi:hypothetical protein